MSNFEAHIAADAELAVALKSYLDSTGSKEIGGFSMRDVSHLEVEIVKDIGTENVLMRLVPGSSAVQPVSFAEFIKEFGADEWKRCTRAEWEVLKYIEYTTQFKK